MQDYGALRFWEEETALWEPLNLASLCLASLLVHRIITTCHKLMTGKQLKQLSNPEEVECVHGVHYANEVYSSSRSLELFV